MEIGQVEDNLFGEIKAEIATSEQAPSDCDMASVAETIEDVDPNISLKDGIYKFYELKQKLLLSDRVNNLSDEELLALLLENGTEEKRIETSKKLLSANRDKLSILFRKDEGDLALYKVSLGEYAAKRLVAVGEILKRVLREDVNDEISLNSSNRLFNVIREMAFLPQEELWLILLNTQLKCTNIVKLTKGSQDGSLFDISLILSHILKRGAKKFIIAHNHPGGSMKPSRYDDDVTAKLKTAAKSLGLTFVDHIIVFGPRDNDYYSYNDRGRI